MKHPHWKESTWRGSSPHALYAASASFVGWLALIVTCYYLPVRHWYKTLPLIPVMVSILGGCKSEQPSVDAWYVLDMRDSHWTVVHTDHTRQQQIRYAVTCDWYQWGNHEVVSGDCDLPVGKMFVWNGLPDKPSNFLDIWVSGGDHLFITEGSGGDRVSQSFTIHSATTEHLDPNLPRATPPRTLADTWKK